MSKPSFRKILYLLTGGLIAALQVFNPVHSQPVDTDWIDWGRFFGDRNLSIVSAIADPDAAPYRVGRPVTWTIQVENTGAHVARVQVSSLRRDLSPGPTSAVLIINPGQTVSTRMSFQIDPQQIRRGRYRNNIFLIIPARSTGSLLERLWRDDNTNDNAIDISIPVRFLRVRLNVNSWFSLSYVEVDSDFACVVNGINGNAITDPWPDEIKVGFISTEQRGADPVPCIEHQLFEFQPYAHFSLAPLPRGARILNATLRFTEINFARDRISGTIPSPATRLVGLIEPPIPDSGIRLTRNWINPPPGSRAPRRTADSSRLSMDITDWVQDWTISRSPASLVFTGYRSGPRVTYMPPSRTTRIASLENVYIDVSYD